jgi:hypothetical protein
MTCKDIIAAKKILNLPDHATMAQIKSRYRELLKQWHPDKNQTDADQCHDMTQKITAAYQIILRYCDQYAYSFERQEVEKYLSPEEWWMDRFGKDPLWGSPGKSWEK